MVQNYCEPNPRRRESRRLERREGILAVAAQHFFEHGYAGVSMSAIAAALGGSKGTLWSYFPSKADLFAAVLEDRTSAYRTELAAVLNPQGDLRTAILEFCRSFILRITSPEAIKLHRLVASEAVRFPEVGEIFQERGPRMTIKALARFLSRHMEEGRLRAENPENVARALMFLCIGPQYQMLWGSASPDERTIETEALFVTTAFLRAFAP
jgi:AcrR family transcriptional regulator